MSKGSITILVYIIGTSENELIPTKTLILNKSSKNFINTFQIY